MPVRNRSAVRSAILIFGLLAAVCAAVPLLMKAFAADSDLPSVRMDASGAGPREVEDLTGQKIVSEYATAWKIMSQALEQNRADLLNRSFVGISRDKLGERIDSQQRDKLRTRTVDHGHTVKVAFYSPEGSTMQLLDTADLEVQVLDGDKVLHSERGPQKFVVLMSVAEAGWRVREIEAVPNF